MSKDNQTRERLLLLAKKEFLRRGFQKVSMRDISAITRMALGNIYYYYKTKDELFHDVLYPVVEQIQQLIDSHNTASKLNKCFFEEEHHNDAILWHFSPLVSQNSDELYLLFFGARGSSFENYSEVLIQKFTAMGIEYIRRMKEIYPEINSSIDPFFMHVYAAIQVSVIKEFILHRKIPKEKLQTFSETYSSYTKAGWKYLMRV